MLNENILQFIPQRAPFVMIDKLIHSNVRATQSSFLVNAENIFVINDKFSEAGLLENIAQTAAAGVGYAARNENKNPVIGYIGAVKDLEIFSLPMINDELITEVEMENRVFDVIFFKGRISSNKIVLAQCELKIVISK